MRLNFVFRFAMSGVCVLLLGTWMPAPAWSQYYADSYIQVRSPWKDLTPEARDEAGQRYFNSLPESEQIRLRKRQLRFQSLPQPSQRKLCGRFYQENGYLPPACSRLLQQ